MNKTRRVTANIPVDLLDKACRVTGKGLTETLVQGLEMVRRSAAARKAAQLKGKLHLHIDVGSLRGRPRR